MKQKRHSGTKKRVKVTGRKKLKMQKACKNHLLVHKAKRQLKLSPNGQIVNPSNKARIKKLLNM